MLSENVLEFLVDNFLDLFCAVGIALAGGCLPVSFIVLHFSGEMQLEIVISVVYSRLLSPFLACTGEEPCVADVFVCETDELGVWDVFSSFIGEFLAVLELGPEIFNGCGRVPRDGHALGVLG